MSVSVAVTQRDVAQACGLHPSTVCLALKNSPSIPVETRVRIQTVAEQLGYHPNVAARNLALLRTEKKPGGSLPIVWLNQEPRRDHWRTNPEARPYLDGARRRAADLGYHLEEIWTQEPGMSTNRIVQIIGARGVEGVVFAVHRTFDFGLLNHAWSDFALVAFNDHRLGEWMDVVCPDYYRNMQMLLRRLQQSDYGRIGLVLSTRFDAATNGLVHGCYLRHQAEGGAGQRLPVCFVPEDADEACEVFAAWMAKHAPEAVICPNPELVQRVRACGADAAFVQLHGSLDAFDAGIDDEPAEIAAAAIECVVEKVRRFEKGPGDSPRLHLLAGSWQDRAVASREAVTIVA